MKTKIPCGVKKNGTINQNEKNRMISTTMFAASGLTNVINEMSKDNGTKTTINTISQITDKRTVWKTARKN